MILINKIISLQKIDRLTFPRKTYRVFLEINIYVCTYMCVYVCMCVCIYIHTYMTTLILVTKRLSRSSGSFSIQNHFISGLCWSKWRRDSYFFLSFFLSFSGNLGFPLSKSFHQCSIRCGRSRRDLSTFKGTNAHNMGKVTNVYDSKSHSPSSETYRVVWYVVRHTEWVGPGRNVYSGCVQLEVRLDTDNHDCRESSAILSITAFFHPPLFYFLLTNQTNIRSYIFRASNIVFKLNQNEQIKCSYARWYIYK